METDVKTGPVAIDGRKNTSGNLKNTIDRQNDPQT